ncbi:hypothetical protein DMB66_06245 [Actinoplanes sp. ATCC 53533]|uniref:hypothetical protein n=1 Tax=Actinoplanes sp. ATCC 53533 TaxID=1288362 RepID=UPI000F781D3E|nr:hypothetical protein [Actinoplanes sp. ATCC 53533]RSM72196.1 hypothetical protein DMB66_06245 [Actinoplanes sp. ATCC 53533]
MIESNVLRQLCIDVRLKEVPVDEALVVRIEQDTEECRDRLRAEPTSLPPADLRERLPLLGWLIYETSLMLLWSVKAEIDHLPAEVQRASRANADLITRLADVARSLPWPEFAPRALGAIRALALVDSKWNDYDGAWLLHQEVRAKHQSYLDSLGDDKANARFVLDLDEVLLQLALAETGTACRTAEETVGHWIEKWGGASVATERREADRWVLRMFRQLSEGAEVGELALGIADRIHAKHGFVEMITESRLIMRTGFRNPAIMTCRALLLMYSLCPAMQRLGMLPPGHDTWPDFMSSLRRRFRIGLAFLVRPAEKADHTPIPLLKDHARAIVQFCLHLALLTASETLDEPLVVDETLTLRRLDDDAAQAMARWLAAPSDKGDGVRGDASIVGCASMPHFIRSVEACRDDAGATANYQQWRKEWTVLDRYGPDRWSDIELMLERDPDGGIW